MTRQNQSRLKINKVLDVTVSKLIGGVNIHDSLSVLLSGVGSKQVVKVNLTNKATKTKTMI